MNARKDRQKEQRAQLNRQLENIQRDNKPKEKNENLIQLGKFFYSLAGMTYAGAVLDFVINMEENRIVELSTAVVGFLALSVAGWMFVKRGNLTK